MSKNLHPDILLIDKPKGITSFDVVYTVRRKLNPKPPVDSPKRAQWKQLKVGHAGTLDPLATGLMIIGVGQGTKKLTEFTKLDKEYIAEVRLGERRTTGDLEGDIVEEKEVSSIPKDEIDAVVASLVGMQRLPVSAYSAIKKDGKPMYKRAREAAQKGVLVTEVPMRDMTVYEAEVIDIDNDPASRGRMVVTVRFAVASGVYIRSLGEEMGKRLGYPATLQNLRRTKVGEFCIEDAQPISDFT